MSGRRQRTHDDLARLASKRGEGNVRGSRGAGVVGGERSPREGAHVIEMQRRRLLTAVAELAYERRTGDLTVAIVCDRARVSRKTFYDLFEDREECLLAAFEDGVVQATAAVIEVALLETGWRDRVRTGLGALLAFFDREPGIARLLIVDALGAGEQTLQVRQQALAQLIAIVEEGRGEAKVARQPPPLTAEGIVGAVFAVIHARLLSNPHADLANPHADARSGGSNGALIAEPPRLAELAGALMAMIVGPYLGPAAAQKELERSTSSQPAVEPRLPADPFKDLPIRVTYRTARVLATIAADPGVSNRQIGDRAGAQDQGQVSKLLARLQRNGLIENHGKGHPTGEPNAWRLTPRGQAVHTALGDGTGGAQRQPAES
jgi:AcrR family transcriptional regulator